MAAVWAAGPEPMTVDGTRMRHAPAWIAKGAPAWQSELFDNGHTNYLAVHPFGLRKLLDFAGTWRVFPNTGGNNKGCW
ncbi:uncharacterized protein PgNI_04195 [Pyricularia grisea]|uniref:Uncharacterized protein n=1 Tax=Pyricularia grisea TaxID=148305 RepID=A0A6P8BEW1_PYRGI|nr:uncharacterized protein PgNI_04195 [Pyricularia grisea]TLD14325.1 hypothetical protein PgNI_04195 [Pyricularia grisea]